MRITIMGLGLFGGGLGAARYFAERGHEVTITDLADEQRLASSLEKLADLDGLRFVLGRHEAADILDCDLVVASPAIPLDQEFLRLRRQEGGAITTEIELVMQKSRQPILAVTGSNGKTTTAHMLTELLKARGRSCRLGGNVGGSLLPEIEALDPEVVLVLELSSFQLERIRLERRPVVGALLTNLSANHLDRHGDMASYEAAKLRLLDFMRPGATLVLDGDDAGSLGWPSKAEERGLSWRALRSAELDDDTRPRCLVGAFNHKNLAMANALAEAFLGPDREALARVAESFRGLPHRLEPIGRCGLREVLNDSKSTTPFATLSALRALTGPVQLIAGGYDKGLAADELYEAFDLCESVVLCGATARKLAQGYEAARAREARRPLRVAATLEEACAWTIAEAMPTGTILFSPGHPSFDHHANFEARGAAFRRAMAANPGFTPL